MTEIRRQLSHLNKMSKKSVAVYHRFALSAGISDSMLGVLYALLEAEEPCSQNDLWGEWSIPKQTVNTAVAGLQKKGFVVLSPVPGTKNKKELSLTDRGRDFAEETVGRLRAAEAAALEELTPGERELYLRLNQKYNCALTRRLNEFFGGPEEDRPTFLQEKKK